MSLPRAAGIAAVLCAVLLAGCGGGDGKPSPPTATTTKPAPLARAPLKNGELVFSGEASPRSYGSFELDGRYVVRFEQYAPEDAKLDFSGQTPFTARLRRADSRRAGEELFSSASAKGTRKLTKHGKYQLDVTFGDFPYAVRFTPRR